ncbi:MAG: cytochrome c3 family protein [Deltaproteobacteria bacterium]|nr:cytochrome c3 family protein [Deltaproteobacteria bacterium]
MKKLLFLIIAGTILMFCSSAWAGISGSVHDFTSTGGPVKISGETQICVFCHTPHNAGAATDAPLWNHAVTTASFTTYSSTTLNATMGQPAGISKLCLSCHDGTVAIDAYGTQTGVPTLMTNDRGALVGTDLSNDHPISFLYDTALASADGGLFNPTDTGHTTALGGTISADLLFGTSSDQLECASCHDVHNGGPTGAGHLLRIDNTGSALCMTCHDK